MVRHDVDPQPPPLTSRHADDAASDATLVAVAQRNLEAFTTLYERYADPVLNYCYHRLGTWAEAEDAAQQVFLHVYTALGRFRDREGSFRSWLFTVAHHEVANRQRGQRRHPTVTSNRGGGTVRSGSDARGPRHCLGPPGSGARLVVAPVGRPASRAGAAICRTDRFRNRRCPGSPTGCGARGPGPGCRPSASSPRH